MGLIRALANSATSAAKSVVSDQWREYFYCDAIPTNVLAVRGRKKTTSHSTNLNATDNIISNGSIIAVADGQCMMIVDQGRIAEFTAEPGEFTYDASSEPSIFAGKFGKNIMQTFATFGRRFTFGGEIPKDQRVYFFNTKELTGNKYGTPNPVPFRVVDPRAGIDIDISIRCFGEYSYRICDPLLFYKNVCGNVVEDYTRDKVDGQLKTELMTALQPAFARISEQGIRYSSLPGHTMEMAAALNEVLTTKWRELRGLEIVSVGVSSVTASEEDEAMIKEMQRKAALGDPRLAAAHLVGAQAAAMEKAAENKNGAMMGFMGMSMAQQAGGINANQLFQQASAQGNPGQPFGYQPGVQPFGNQPGGANAQPAANGWTCACGASVTGNFCPQCGAKKPEPKPEEGSWTCACGASVTGNFCPECGAKKPEAKPDGWACSCGAINKGKFCTECGAKKPAGVPQYRCDKCGWEPTDPAHPPKFCPECGDPFGDEDLQ